MRTAFFMFISIIIDILRSHRLPLIQQFPRAEPPSQSSGLSVILHGLHHRHRRTVMIISTRFTGSPSASRLYPASTTIFPEIFTTLR